MTARHIIFMNSLGDVEISWDEEQDGRMKAVIEAKMKAGVVFYTLGRFLGIKHRKKISKVSQIEKGTVSFDDPDLEEMFRSGQISAAKGTIPDGSSISRLSTADEVVKSKGTVAARKNFAGG